MEKPKTKKEEGDGRERKVRENGHCKSLKDCREDFELKVQKQENPEPIKGECMENRKTTKSKVPNVFEMSRQSLPEHNLAQSPLHLRSVFPPLLSSSLQNQQMPPFRLPSGVLSQYFSILLPVHILNVTRGGRTAGNDLAEIRLVFRAVQTKAPRGCLEAGRSALDGGILRRNKSD